MHSPSLSLSSSSHQFSPRANGISFPALVSLKKDKTASVALLSPNMALTDGTTGPLFSHSLQILFHMTRAWPAHAGRLATRRNLDWRSSVLQNHHLSESTFSFF